MNRRWIGAGAVAAGLLALLLGRSTVPSGPWAAPVAALAVVVGALVFTVDRPDTAVDRWTPSDPEPGHGVPTPADRFADLHDREIRERLRNRAVASLVAQTECSRADAVAKVDAGAWTDDRIAAAYLADDRRTPRTTRFAGWVRREPADERARRRALAALRELRGGSDG